jgi:hypothetical protein
MKKIKTNLHYFEISKANPEKLLDDFYIFCERKPDLDKYIQNTKEIKNILITIKTLKENNEKKEIIEKYFLELQKTLGEYSNCSEFGCFINACDNIIEKVKTEIDLLKDITEKYLEKRTLNDLVPAEWVQAVWDGNSSRRKGKTGENKLIAILEAMGFKEVLSWNDFFENDYCVAEFSKAFGLENVRKNLNVKIKAKKQGKKLDLIIKIKDKIIICEAKHLNTSGGGQDKQIAELIEITSLKERPDVSYLAFVDGKYSSIIFGETKSKRKKKITKQKDEINKFLIKNANNYWVNTAGFEALIKDLKN